jgi:peptide/nickel transport system substrate-binding protein
MLRKAACLLGASLFATQALAQEGEPVPEIHFLSWPTATYQHFAETANYIAEEWEKLGLQIRMDQQAFPNPMLQMWFTDHDFDVVMSNLSGAPHRLEPDFFTNAQFNSANTAPGNWNVGEYSNPELDALGQKQLGIYDPEERREIVHELQRMIVEEQPEAIVAAPVTVFAVNKNNMEFANYVDSPQGVRANVNQVRMKSKRDQDLIRVGWTVEYTVLNPTAARTIEETELAALIYDRLLWIAPDGSPQMRLAQSIDTIDDTTLEVTIRTGHTFSDGQPVTAEDVKFSFDYMKEWNAPYFTQHLERIESVEAVDEATIRFKLTEPYAPFVMNTLGQMYVLPRHVWEPLVEELGLENPQQYANDQPVGSGPFTIRYRREGSELYLARREDHFDPPLSDILYVIYGSAEIVAQSLKTGSIDVSFQPVPPAGVEEFKQHPNLQLYTAESNGHMSLRYKTTGPVFWNRDLRRALFHAIPYDRIADEVLGGMAVLSSSPITPVNAYWHNPELPKPRFDPDKAREILEEAGFTWDSDGRLHFPPT